MGLEFYIFCLYDYYFTAKRREILRSSTHCESESWLSGEDKRWLFMVYLVKEEMGYGAVYIGARMDSGGKVEFAFEETASIYKKLKTCTSGGYHPLHN